LTVPGAGSFSAITDLSLSGYNACMEVRSFLGQLSPFFMALGMPLCVIGCVTSVLDIFDTEQFPPINVGAIPKMVEKCKCLASFTPFGFCGTISGLLNAVVEVLRCVRGLIGDIAVQGAQIAAMLADGDDNLAYQAECLAGVQAVQLKNLTRSLGPVAELWDSAAFLFEFVGIPFVSLSTITQGGDVASMLRVLDEVLEALTSVRNALTTICP
jgi:hypothetical protein